MAGNYTYRINDAEFRREIQREKLSARIEAQGLVELTLNEALEFAKSYTNETVPDPRGGTRKLHPGGWGDITTNLRNSMQAQVKVSGLRITGTLSTILDYAEELEAREGIEVFGGFDRSAQQALRRHATQFGLEVHG